MYYYSWIHLAVKLPPETAALPSLLPAEQLFRTDLRSRRDKETGSFKQDSLRQAFASKTTNLNTKCATVGHRQQHR